MSSRFLPHRHSYTEPRISGDDSSESGSSSYLDDFRGYRNGANRSRESANRSIRSSRQSLKSDNDSDRLSRRNQRMELKPRRDSSTQSRARSRLRSMTTEESEGEATRALVQAKIREKVAQQSSMDESSSDFWKPKNGEKNESATVTNKTNGARKEATAASKTKEEPVVTAKAKISTAVKKENGTTGELKTKTAETKTADVIQTKVKKTKIKKVEKDAEKDKQIKTAENDIKIDAPDGPAPSTPNYEWECEFCTFTNEPNTKICAICCKTPTTVAIQKSNEISINQKERKSSTTKESSKGMKIPRKISFWPGTKTK